MGGVGAVRSFNSQRSFKCQCYNYIANAEFVMCKATRFGICPWYYRFTERKMAFLSWSQSVSLPVFAPSLSLFFASTLISTPEKTLTRACVSLKFSFFEPQYGGTTLTMRLNL